MNQIKQYIKCKKIVIINKYNIEKVFKEHSDDDVSDDESDIESDEQEDVELFERVEGYDNYSVSTFGQGKK